jgi:ABC-type polysaccharide/polyol phosphate export permease
MAYLLNHSVSLIALLMVSNGPRLSFPFGCLFLFLLPIVYICWFSVFSLSILSMFFPSIIRVLASIMAESSYWLHTCDRNSIHRLVGTLAYTHCRELMKPVKL